MSFLKKMVAVAAIAINIFAPPARAQYNPTWATGLPDLPMQLPQTISKTATGSYLIPDSNADVIWEVPEGGGQATVFYDFRPNVTAALGNTWNARGGMFLPTGAAWGANAGKFLNIGSYFDRRLPTGQRAREYISVFDGGVESRVYEFVNPFDRIVGFSTALVGTESLFSDRLLVTTQVKESGSLGLANTGSIKVFRPDFSVEATFFAPDTVDPYGAAIAPIGFGSVGNTLLVSEVSGGRVYSMDASGNFTLFTTLPNFNNVLENSFGLRQMEFAPAGFLSHLGLTGEYLLVSMTGSYSGGGALGALVAVDETGQVVAHLQVGSYADKFDPRGVFFEGDTLLVSDAADPIGSAPATTFAPGVPASAAAPEPGTFALMLCSLVGMGSLAPRKRFCRR
jgi:hypothetical protein